MKVDIFLSRLEKAKMTGNGTWLACCPAHEDEHPSMTVRELEDGRVLVHCFAGCAVEQILHAVDLEFDALFPDKEIEYGKPERRPFPAADVLEAISAELLFIGVIASMLHRGEKLSDVEHQRLFNSIRRVEEARRLILG